MTGTSCSWCHTLNSDGADFCRSCGHKAHIPRLKCDCDHCQPPGTVAPPGRHYCTTCGIHLAIEGEETCEECSAAG